MGSTTTAGAGSRTGPSRTVGQVHQVHQDGTPVVALSSADAQGCMHRAPAARMRTRHHALVQRV